MTTCRMMRWRYTAAIGAIVLAAIVAVTRPASASGGPTERFVCGNDIAVTFNDSAGAILWLGSEEIFLDFGSYIDGAADFVAETGPNSWVVRRVADDAIVVLKNQDEPLRCPIDKENAAREAAAQQFVSTMGNYSLGGKVRSGPGMNYDQTDSLQLGEPIILVRRTGVMMNNYEWFEIEYSEGVRGFQWGGIMCSRALHVVGLFETCPDEIPQ